MWYAFRNRSRISRASINRPDVRYQDAGYGPGRRRQGDGGRHAALYRRAAWEWRARGRWRAVHRAIHRLAARWDEVRFLRRQGTDPIRAGPPASYLWLGNGFRRDEG